jgi:hypothetical protein
MKAKSFTVIGLIIFTTLSLIDLVQTWVLMDEQAGRIYEGNPLARHLLEHYGWQGLIVFKILVILTVITAVGLLMRYRPGTSALVTIFGCLVLLAVTFYSRQLLKLPLPTPEKRQPSPVGVELKLKPRVW